MHLGKQINKLARMKIVCGLVLLAVLATCYAGIPFKACGGTGVKFNEIGIYNATWNCSVEPCIIYKGANVSVSIDFQNIDLIIVDYAQPLPRTAKGEVGCHCYRAFKIEHKIMSFTLMEQTFCSSGTQPSSFAVRGKGNDLSDVTNSVYGIYLHVTVPFPGYPDNQKDACKLNDSSSHCPIKKGDNFKEKVTLPITTAAISGVIAEWKLMDQNQDMVGCFEVSLKIE